MALRSTARPVGAAPIDRTEDHRAQFVTSWLPPTTALISAHGDIDASNASGLAEYAMAHTEDAACLMLDLTGVGFFGTAGFAALNTVDTSWSRRGLDWMLIPGDAVNRLLRICDPDYRLQRRNTVPAALSALRGETPLLQLVAQSR